MLTFKIVLWDEDFNGNTSARLEFIIHAKFLKAYDVADRMAQSLGFEFFDVNRVIDK